MSTLTLIFLVFLGSPSFIRLAAAANQCFAADDGGYDMMTNKGGVLYHAVRDYVSQDCANNKNCAIGQTYGWPMNSWCVGDVTDMSWLFYGMDTFNEDISGWDTSSVTDMNYMFSFATSFNGDLSAWVTSSVVSMHMMFAGGKYVGSFLCCYFFILMINFTHRFLHPYSYIVQR